MHDFVTGKLNLGYPPLLMEYRPSFPDEKALSAGILNRQKLVISMNYLQLSLNPS